MLSWCCCVIISWAINTWLIYHDTGTRMWDRKCVKNTTELLSFSVKTEQLTKNQAQETVIHFLQNLFVDNVQEHFQDDGLPWRSYCKSKKKQRICENYITHHSISNSKRTITQIRIYLHKLKLFDVSLQLLKRVRNTRFWILQWGLTLADMQYGG